MQYAAVHTQIKGINKVINFDKIIAIGLGKLAFQCVDYVAQNYGIVSALYDVNDSPSKFLKQVCGNCDVTYYSYTPDKLFEILKNEQAQTLIISATNPLIMPKQILEKDNVKAINLHHALLPEHPGRNGEAWAIFEQDEWAGITWHMLIPSVDKGEIIVQKKCAVDDTTTSIKLMEKMNNLAYEAFKEFIEALLYGEVAVTKQSSERKSEFHFSKDKPNNGYIDVNWDISKISAFLRAYDYGIIVSPFGIPKIRIDDCEYTWKKYKIEKVDQSKQKLEILEDEIIFSGKSVRVVLSGLKRLSSEMNG